MKNILIRTMIVLCISLFPVCFLCASAKDEITLYANGRETECYTKGSFKAESFGGGMLLVALYKDDMLVSCAVDKNETEAELAAEINIDSTKDTQLKVFRFDSNLAPICKPLEVKPLEDCCMVFVNSDFEDSSLTETDGETLKIEEKNGNGFLSINKTEGKAAIYPIAVANPTSQIIYEADYKFNGIFNTRLLSERSSTEISTYLRCRGENICIGNTNTAIAKFSVGEPMHIALALDYSTGCFDVYINGDWAGSGDSLSNASKFPKKRTFQICSVNSTGSGELEVDNIRVYSGDQLLNIGGARPNVSLTDDNHVLLAKYKNVIAVNTDTKTAIVNGEKSHVEIISDEPLIFSAEGESISVSEAEANGMVLTKTEFGLWLLTDGLCEYTDSELWELNRFLIYDRPEAEEIAAKCINAQRPRLLLSGNKVDNIRVSADPDIVRLRESVIDKADYALTQKTYSYGISSTGSMRDIPESLEMMMNLGMAYMLTGNLKYTERAWAEAQTLCEFEDWNSSKFLDVGEVTAILGITYDWMYDAWTPEQRKTISDAILEKGVNLLRKIYFNEPVGNTYASWWDSDNNYNVVGNGGCLLGALAILENNPEVCAKVSECTIRAIENMLVKYFPDGGWEEGGGYWGYALKYLTMCVASMENALGSDYGYLDTYGISKTGWFGIALETPTGIMNIGDTENQHLNSAAILFWAEKFSDTALSVARRYCVEKYGLEETVFDLVYSNSSAGTDEFSLPEVSYVKGVEILSLRSGVGAKDTYIGISGGTGDTNHGHLDSGAFIIDMKGERFAVDIGADKYNAPGYFGAQRYKYYRTRPEGHNLFVINPNNSFDNDGNEYYGQSLTAVSKIAEYEDGYGIINLSDAYERDATSVMRGVRITKNGGVEIRDEIVLKDTAELHWYFHTDADEIMLLSDSAALLTKNGVSVIVKFTSDAGAALSVKDAVRYADSEEVQDTLTNGVKKLDYSFSGAQGQLFISVQICSADNADTLPESIELKEWGDLYENNN